MAEHPASGARPDKKELHARNRHRGRYDLARLGAASPALAPFVAPNAHGDLSIDFANPDAVLALNRAVLAADYGITSWELPPGRLCPPIPGRADYVHHAADLLASTNGGVVPRGAAVRVLDVGVGASCIYPIVGHVEYGWNYVGSDIDPVALDAARRIVAANASLTGAVELRLQPSPGNVFTDVVKAGESFALVMCNPPFHASEGEAREGTKRKWKNLGKPPASAALVKNFGGEAAELWCEGGEAGFLGRMIDESARFGDAARWFTATVSKEATLDAVGRALARARATETRIIGLETGNKKGRIVAWTFAPKR